MRGLSPSLEGAYASLWQRFGPAAYSSADAARVLGGSDSARNMQLARLVTRGWQVRIGRGQYKLLRPISPLSEAATDWPRKVRSRSAHDVIRLALSALDGALGERLLSVTLFGSYARGRPHPESDVDFLVVVRDPAPSPTTRWELNAAVGDACRRRVAWEWERTRTYPVPDVVVLTAQEAARGSAFLLDASRDLVVLYDRAGTFQRAVQALLSRATELGARRIERSKDDWYWVMPRGVSLDSVAAGG